MMKSTFQPVLFLFCFLLSIYVPSIVCLRILVNNPPIGTVINHYDANYGPTGVTVPGTLDYSNFPPYAQIIVAQPFIKRLDIL